MTEATLLLKSIHPNLVTLNPSSKLQFLCWLHGDKNIDEGGLFIRKYQVSRPSRRPAPFGATAFPMFRPQPSSYAAFASYGAARQHNAGQDDYQFQSSHLPIGLASGGPIVFDNPVFAPAGFGATQLRPAMDTPPNDDLVAQEALARQYQPELKVRKKARADVQLILNPRKG